MVYDATSKTAYTGRSRRTTRAAPQARARRARRRPPRPGEARPAVDAVRRPAGVTADQPSYTVRIAPKDDGGLLGAVELAWDAVRGVPLRAAIYAQGTHDPVLELEATEIAYGTIAASKIDATPPAGAKVTEIDPPTGVDAQGKPTHVEGVESRPEAARLPARRPGRRWPGCRAAACGWCGSATSRARCQLRRGPRRDPRLPEPRGAGRQAVRRRPRRAHPPAGQHRRRDRHRARDRARHDA